MIPSAMPKECRAGIFALILGLLFLAPSAVAQPDWTPGGNYTTTMTVTASLDIGGSVSSDPADLLAAFVGGEVRGVASPQDVGGSFRFFLNIGANTNGEGLSFQAYDASTDTIFPVCEGLLFAGGGTRGSVSAPFAFFSDDGACPLHWTAPSGFPAHMNVNASVFFGVVRSIDVNDRVAAFTGPELRGVGTPFTVGSDQVFLIDVSGQIDGESLTFRAYDASTGTEYTMDQAITFSGGTTTGTPGTPLALHTAAALPVELSSFEARRDGDEVLLSWATASETNNAGFSVEMAAADAAWAAAGFVAGHGTTTFSQAYAFRVPTPMPGVYRFRLKQLDFDGTAAYSETASVTVELPGAFALTAPFPNPALDYLEISLSVAVPQRVRVALFDVLGRRVRVLYAGQMYAHRPIRMEIETVGLPAGMYLIGAAGAEFSAARPVTVMR